MKFWRKAQPQKASSSVESNRDLWRRLQIAAIPEKYWGREWYSAYEAALAAARDALDEIEALNETHPR